MKSSVLYVQHTSDNPYIIQHYHCSHSCSHRQCETQTTVRHIHSIIILFLFQGRWAYPLKDIRAAVGAPENYQKRCPAFVSSLGEFELPWWDLRERKNNIFHNNNSLIPANLPKYFQESLQYVSAFTACPLCFMICVMISLRDEDFEVMSAEKWCQVGEQREETQD